MPDECSFKLDRREFVGATGVGLLISMWGQSACSLRGDTGSLRARLHIGDDGVVTVFTGKVDLGQDSRTEVTMAAAEEIRLPLDQVRVVMGDTERTPDDGGTSGSRTTPYTIPDIRRAAAAAREVLIRTAGQRWKVDVKTLVAREGKVVDASANREIGYGELAGFAEAVEAFADAVPEDIALRETAEWDVMGTSPDKVDNVDFVTGRHLYPSDIQRPGMLFGKVLRAPAYRASLQHVDLAPARKMEGVTAVQDGDFVGCTASTSHLAAQAVEAIAKTARWETGDHPSSDELYDHLRQNAIREGSGRGGPRTEERGSLEEGLGRAEHVLKASYQVPYIQHAPLEPRAAVAEWSDGAVTVWTGSQNPRRVQQQVAEAFNLPTDKVRVLIPDTGGAFGGKHTGETAIEAARLARACERPVSLRWTREEEFTWAYFRPAAVYDIEGGVTSDGALTAWDYVTHNPGAAGLLTPYRVENCREQSLSCNSPLREGSYRTLAATANNFAREGFMDELAVAAGLDPLAFRLNNLDNERMLGVLKAASERFRWKTRKQNRKPGIGVGIACGTEKGSYVAACVEVEADKDKGTVIVREVCEAFECGAVVNPRNLEAQVEGCILMGLGAAMTEEIEFKNGKILNPRFSRYRVPRLRDVPKLDTVLVNRKDLPSAGGGETPIIVIAPAIANAVFDATGVRVRSLPVPKGLAG